MRTTFEKFFVKNGGKQSLNRLKTNPGNERRAITPNKTSYRQSEISTKSAKDRGIEKLSRITKDLRLNPKTNNIMDPKILESWINETLIEVERLDSRSISHSYHI
jgi:hypothetical protein